MSFKPNYILMSSAKYKVNIAKIGYNPYDPSQIKNKKQFRDIEITRNDIPTDLQCLDTHSLITINGFIHPTVWKDAKLYVKEATPNMQRASQRKERLMNQVGLISFMNLGTPLEKLEIKEEMLYKTKGPNDVDYNYVERVTIDFGKPIDGNFLVLAGYIISEQEGFFERLSPSSFVLYPERLRLTEKFMELMKYYDIFDEFGIETSKFNESNVMNKDLISDETILKLLLRYNTFLVHFKGHRVSYNRVCLDYSRIPNLFRIDTLPRKKRDDETQEEYELTKGGFERSILIGGYGKIIEYKAKQVNIYKTNIMTLDATYDDLVMSHAPIDLDGMASNSRKLLGQYELSNCFFLQILLDKI